MPKPLHSGRVWFALKATRSSQKSADIGGGHMALDRVAAHRRGMAGFERVRDTLLTFERRKLFNAALFKADREPVVTKVTDPGIATGTARILDHMNRQISLRKCTGRQGKRG